MKIKITKKRNICVNIALIIAISQWFNAKNILNKLNNRLKRKKVN